MIIRSTLREAGGGSLLSKGQHDKAQENRTLEDSRYAVVGEGGIGQG